MKVGKPVKVKQPAIIGYYNKNMGGVDLNDMMQALYRIDHKSRKWYRRIFFWVLSAILFNSWKQYKKDCDTINSTAKTKGELVKPMQLRGVVLAIATCLVSTETKTPKK